MHYVLKWKCQGVMQIITIICLFFTVFPNNLVNFFCKGLWSAYNNIIYTNICQKFVLIVKFHISVRLTITTFLLELLLSS